MSTVMEQAFSKSGLTPKKRNTVFVGAIESIYKDQVFQKYGWIFVNNAQSYAKMNKAENVKIIDCRSYVASPNPIQSLIEEIQKTSVIHKLIISCHSDPEALYIFSRTRYDLPDDHKFLTASSDWNSLNLAVGGDIILQGCQTAGYHGEPLEECIAQSVADKTLCDVYGFINKSSQKKIGENFEQKAVGGYRLVKPRWSY